MDKNNVNVTPEDKKKTVEAFFRYYELSSLLFDNSRSEIYNVTDIPANNKFSKLAKKTAKELMVTWNTMTHEDSNRIMLAMLEELFNLIRDIEKSSQVTLNLSIKPRKKQ